MRAVVWPVLLLLLAVGAAQATPKNPQPPMPDPCIEAPNLPFCP